MLRAFLSSRCLGLYFRLDVAAGKTPTWDLPVDGANTDLFKHGWNVVKVRGCLISSGIAYMIDSASPPCSPQIPIFRPGCVLRPLTTAVRMSCPTPSTEEVMRVRDVGHLHGESKHQSIKVKGCVIGTWPGLGLRVEGLGLRFEV